MKWYKKPHVIRKIVLAVANVFAMLLFFFVGMAKTSGHIGEAFVIMAVGELIFLILSLIVYYLSVIASAVSKMANDSIKNYDE